jgi:hypothetical protein
MKKKDLRSYNLKKVNELEKELVALKLDFTKTRLNIISGREKNLKKAKNIGKKISQIMMLIRYKKIEEKAEEKI